MSDPVQTYLDAVGDPARAAALAHVRSVVLAHLSDARPVMSYNLPAFEDPESGKVVCGFAATAKGCSFYPFSGTTVGYFADRLAGFGTTKGSIHFTPEHPLPDELLVDIIAQRLEEIGVRGR